MVDEDVRKRRRREGDVRAAPEQCEHVTDGLVDCGRVGIFLGVDRGVVRLIVEHQHRNAEAPPEEAACSFSQAISASRIDLFFFTTKT